MERKLTDEQILEITKGVPSWTSPEERGLLMKLAREVPENGHIVEIGSLYGGSTVVLGLAAPISARITAIDEFSWSPTDVKASAAQLDENVRSCGLDNVTIIEKDSRQAWQGWNEPIDLLFVDGGHSYEYVYSDLTHFGPFAKVICGHDYTNPFWESVTRAFDTFVAENKKFKIADRAGWVVALRRK